MDIQVTFEKLLEDPQFKNILRDMGIHKPTPIQEKAIPLIADGQDVICQANTGSGKTFAFALPIVARLQKAEEIQVLVLVPTRELCEQVTEEFRKITKHKQINILEVYGGVSIENQIRKARYAQVIVATPGRLLDLLKRRALRLDKVNTLILDEADRMFDMGFIRDVETIIRETPKNRQTIMLSATVPKEVHHLVQRYMRNQKIIKTEDQVDIHLLKQYFYVVQVNDRFHLLVHLLRKEKSPYAIVFCGTRRAVDLLAYNLTKNGIAAHAIHGGLTQAMRKRVMTSFHERKTQILVASDVAARGLDIKLLTHVYNFDVPKSAQEYIHRIGRTARAGEGGIAVTLVSQKDYENFRNIQQDNSVKIKQLETPSVPLVEFARVMPRSQHKPQRPFAERSRGPPRRNNWNRRGR